MESTILALVPVAVGGFIAFLGGLVGAQVQAQREHRRWMRERRFEAYVDLVALLSRHLSRDLVDRRLASVGLEKSAELSTVIASLTNEVPNVISKVDLLGPANVIAAKNAWLRVSNTGSDDERAKATSAFLAVARAVLEIDPKK